MVIHDPSKQAGLSCSIPVPAYEVAGIDLAAEHILDVFINDRPAMHLACTPDHLDELAVGRLFTEGLIADPEDILGLHICEEGLKAKLLLREEADAYISIPEMDTVPTCCTGNRIFFRPADSWLPPVTPVPWKKEWIRAMAEAILHDAPLYRKTHAVHSCGLARDGELLCLREDIGRHNALDKAIGFGLISGIDLRQCVLFTTGRMPVDMVSKVIRAGVPVFASKTYPTDQAVGLAKEKKLTLLTLPMSGNIITWNAQGKTADSGNP